jgi:hypothetical protein
MGRSSYARALGGSRSTDPALQRSACVARPFAEPIYWAD